MSVSLPSKEVMIIDVPDVKKFEAAFQYNFHVPEEGIDTVQGVPRKVLERPTDQFDSQYIDVLASRVPRFVKLKWSPVTIAPAVQAVTEEEQRKVKFARGSDLAPDFLRKNLSKVLNEESFAAQNFTSINLNDQSIDKKLFNMVSGAAVFLNEDKAHAQALTKNKLAKETNALTSEEVDYQFLSRYLVQPSEDNVFFYEQNSQRIRNEAVNKLKDVFINVQVNNKFIAKIVDKATTNPFSTYASDFTAMHEVSRVIQKGALGRSATDMINDDYKTYLNNHIGIFRFPSTATTTTTSARVIGYIIDKKEILEDGTVIDLDPVVVQNPYVGLTIDYRVKYYATYQYQVRSVAEFSIPSIVEETQELVIVKVLVSSKPTNPVRISCHERVPPPWPTDFNQHWDYERKKLVMTWTFPPNSQRDVKKFQVFRRKTLDEPFQLMIEYDFDDSVVRKPNNENPNPNRVLRYADAERKRVIEPRLIYEDDEFTKDSKFIYTLCCVDAHNMSSNFCEQTEVSFDRFKNKLIKKRISVGGAPKPYPNLYLLTEAFVDTILDENHRSVRIAFDPEYLALFDSKQRDIRLLATTAKNGKYRFQFINLDLQKEQAFEVELEDLRLHKAEENRFKKKIR